MIFDKKAITLIEILIVVAIIGIIAGVGGLVFETGVFSWNFAQDSLLAQEAAKEVVSMALEGNDFSPGIREALSIEEATKTSLKVLPFWRDVYTYKGGARIFYLTKNLAEDARIPICWVKSPGSLDFVLTEVELMHDQKGHFINIPQDIKSDSVVKILYKADPKLDPSVYMRIYYDATKQTIMRQYGLKSENITRQLKNIKVSNCRFSYLTNAGFEIPFDASGNVPAGKIQDVSGISLDIQARKKDESFELASFVGMRNLKNKKYGLTLSEGDIINIPDSQNIKGLSINYISGAKGGDLIKIAIGKNDTDLWFLEIKFGVIEGKTYIINYNIQYPVGIDVFSSGPAKIDPEDGLNLLTLDKNGLYDYDDDLDISDRAIIKGENVYLKVLKMDPDSATAYIRP